MVGQTLFPVSHLVKNLTFSQTLSASTFTVVVLRQRTADNLIWLITRQAMLTKLLAAKSMPSLIKIIGRGYGGIDNKMECSVVTGSRKPLSKVSSTSFRKNGSGVVKDYECSASIYLSSLVSYSPMKSGNFSRCE